MKRSRFSEGGREFSLRRPTAPLDQHPQLDPTVTTGLILIG